MSEAPIFREIICDWPNVSHSDLDLIIRGGGAYTSEALTDWTLIVELAEAVVILSICVAHIFQLTPN